MKELAGLTALVTGASRGIGAEIATRLAASGATVAVLARDRRALAALCKRIGPRRAFPFPCDLGDSQHRRDALQALDQKFGSNIDLVINNAAYGGPFHGIAATGDEEWQRYLEVNLTAPFELCRHFLPHMMRRGFGRIVNISSILGLAGGPESAAYAATKHAIVGLTRSLALEAAPMGVTVNAICPGFIDTAMVAGGRQPEAVRSIPAKRLGTAREVADLVHFVCRRDSGYINGACLTIDGAILAGIPSTAR